MNCKEFEKKIPEFVQQNMDYKSLKQFCEHVNTCEECREELTIHFLVSEGLQRLEKGGAFDLQKELEQRMGQANRQLRWHRRIFKMSVVLEILAVLMIAVAIIWLVV